MENLPLRFRCSVLVSDEVDERIVKELNALLAQLPKKLRFQTERQKLIFNLFVGMIVVVARIDMKIVGMATVSNIHRIGKKVAEINDFVVDAQYRRQGIAGEILKKLIEEARVRYQSEELQFTVDQSLAEVQQFFHNHQFDLKASNCFSLQIKV